MIPSAWTEIPVNESMSPQAQRMALRLNSLASLYYFSKYTLMHDRLSPRLHGPLCRLFERDSFHLMIEFPRDHLKTTIASISAPMWWALPFTETDEQLMRSVGMGDEWIRWMKRAHDPGTRTLIASEVIGNSRKMGAKISGHYQSNARFRNLFPEIIPTKSDRWNQDSMTHRRPDGVYHGEGTYDLIGVKGALQSRHYDRSIEDDLVGEKAIYSDLVMESTIEWHKKLPGVMDADPDDPNRVGDQAIIGNRWSHRDLNSWTRDNEPHYEIHTHSATGGCCAEHPAGRPIWPEMFTMEKLNVIRQTEGSYNFACHFENNPVDPQACRFKEQWLPRYGFDIVDGNRIAGIRHETANGVVMQDVNLNSLHRVAILDVNHSGDQGRCRHAIMVFGYLPRTQDKSARIYLLESWAESCSFEKMIDKLISKEGLAQKWKCHHLYVETVAGQDGWYYLFQQKMRTLNLEAGFTVRKLQVDRSAGAKLRRIEGMEAIYENGMFWVRRSGYGVEAFLEEYRKYPNGRTIDMLDVAGYIPQVMSLGSAPMAKNFMASQNRRHMAQVQSLGVCGY